jgi:transcriptional regulator with XRE-family HTH domain
MAAVVFSGERARALRGNRAQREVARAVGIDPDHLRNLERGRGDPRLSLAVRLAAELGCAVDDLVRWSA